MVSARSQTSPSAQTMRRPSMLSTAKWRHPSNHKHNVSCLSLDGMTTDPRWRLGIKKTPNDSWRSLLRKVCICQIQKHRFSEKQKLNIPDGSSTVINQSSNTIISGQFVAPKKKSTLTKRECRPNHIISNPFTSTNKDGIPNPLQLLEILSSYRHHPRFEASSSPVFFLGEPKLPQRGATVMRIHRKPSRTGPEDVALRFFPSNLKKNAGFLHI